MRSGENLAILRATEEVIILNKIRFAEEIRNASELVLPPKTGIKKAKPEMVVSLVNQLTGQFDITAYKDTYVDALWK